MLKHTELIERLAREAGMETERDPDDGKLTVLGQYCDDMTETFQRFAALVAEECAKVVEAAPDRYWSAATIREKFGGETKC